MFRLLLLLILVLATSLSVSWLLDHPGGIIIHWLGYRVETSLAFFGVAALLLACLCFLLFQILHLLFGARQVFGYERRLKRQQLGIKAVTEALTAFAVSDLPRAERKNDQAIKYLGRSPISLLISAQLARAEGDERRLRMHLEEMLDSKETESMAMRGLIELARQKGNIADALRFVEHAKQNRDPDGWTVAALVDLYTRENGWQEAVQVVERGLRSGQLSRGQARRYQTVIYTLEARKLLTEKHYSLAASFAQKAHKLLPDFIPALSLLIQAQMALGKTDHAAKLVLKHWKQAPHPLIAAHCKHIFATAEADVFLRFAKKLAASNPDSELSRLVLAEALIAHGAWQEAQGELLDALAKDESRHTALLIAKVQRDGIGDRDAAATWELRAANASSEPEWVCRNCAATAGEWTAHCGNCHAFDSFAWQKPGKFRIEPPASLSGS